MGSLDQLYQQIILDHAKEKHGFGLREPGPDGYSGQCHQLNPLCGDEVTLRVDVTGFSGSDVVRDVSWSGDGCSISQAATSTLYDLVVGGTLDQAGTVVAAFREMVRSRGGITPDEEVLGDASAFAGVGRHANRVKCAMLGWTAFEVALREAQLTDRSEQADDQSNDQSLEAR